MTPTREKFWQKRHDEQTTMIHHLHQQSEQVVLCTGGYVIKVSNPSFLCPDHGLVASRCC
jgi:hypothetical protein